MDGVRMTEWLNLAYCLIHIRKFVTASVTLSLVSFKKIPKLVDAWNVY
jgi:hypothetical protein